MKKIQDVSGLTDEEIVVYSKKTFRYIGLCLSICLLTLVGVLLVPIGGLGNVEYYAGLAAVLSMCLFVMYAISDYRIIRYEMARRAQLG